MIKYIIGVLLLIAAALSWMIWGIGVPNIYSEAYPQLTTPHLFNTPDRSVENIHIFAVYFVPSDKTYRQVSDWRMLMESNLKQLSDFHKLQLQGHSQISYSIYPEIITGFSDALSYDTEVTQSGNPRALVSVSEEIEARVFNPGGDLFKDLFIQKDDDEHRILFIMYEGVGASGGIIHQSKLETAEEVTASLDLPESIIFVVDIENVDGFFLLNREFLSGVEGAYGETLLAHEFYHTLGIPDFYLAPKDVATSQDIMGEGRGRPLRQTYLERDILKQLGL